MADAVSQGAVPAAPPAEAKHFTRPRPAPNVPRRRFGLAYLLLAAILGAAVGLLVLLVSDGFKSGGKPWSDWKPTQRGVRRLDQISKHVARQYALANGKRLVLVLSTPPEVESQGQPAALRAIAVSSGLPGETAQDAAFYDASTAWVYDLCGTSSGGTCALPGKPSVARYNLLRREALELALYTLKYEPALDSVITYMPPANAAGATADTAIFLRRQDLAPALKVPLARTLSPVAKPLRPGKMSKHDLRSVRRYTEKRIYQYEFKQLQDGTPVLALLPLRT